MAKTNLLKEAIADAKAVRETALANAKIALEEAFTPRIQSMLSAKLAEEEEAAVEEPVAEDEHAEEAPVEEQNGEEAPVEEPVAEQEEAPVEEPAMEEQEEEVPVEEQEGEEDLELEAIIKELEDEIEEQSDSSDIGAGDNKLDAASADDVEDPGKGDLTEEGEEAPVEEPVAEQDEEDVSIDEITLNMIKDLRMQMPYEFNQYILDNTETHPEEVE